MTAPPMYLPTCAYCGLPIELSHILEGKALQSVKMMDGTREWCHEACKAKITKGGSVAKAPEAP